MRKSQLSESFTGTNTHFLQKICRIILYFCKTGGYNCMKTELEGKINICFFIIENKAIKL